MVEASAAIAGSQTPPELGRGGGNGGLAAATVSFFRSPPELGRIAFAEPGFAAGLSGRGGGAASGVDLHGVKKP